jgi:murein DD-endopeptidase MepM/ murein hydrolase activator NlpD
MISKPYSSCIRGNVSQIFGFAPCSYQPNGHTGVDFMGSYGSFLLAPELCKVTNIVDNIEKLDTDVAPFERGYGIVMKSLVSGVYYLYWHCTPFFPVKIGDTVVQGQPVAMMGNSGFCISRGEVVPLNIRNVPPYIGTHLHFECFTEEDGVRKFQDVLPMIDWNIPVKPDLLTAISEIANKISNLFK